MDNRTEVALFQNGKVVRGILEHFNANDQALVTSGDADGINSTLNFTNSTGGTFTVTNSALLFNDAFVTSGVFDAGTGAITFTNSSGGTFTVTGFESGTVTSVTGSAPVVSSGGNTPDISVTTAAVTNGSTSLSTGDQIYDFVAGFTAPAANRVVATLDGGTTSEYMVTFVPAAGTVGIGVYGSLTYNPGEANLTSTNFTGALAGNAATATALETARNIAGVSFNGTGDISLNNNAITNGAGYTTNTGTVDTSGSPIDDDFAKFTDANTIEGRSIAETKTDLSLNNVENKSSATIRSEIVSGNIPNNAADTTGNADTATKIASITNSNIVQLTSTQTLTNKTLTSPTITGPDITGTANLDAVDIDGNVQLDGTLTVGVDDTGYDVKFFGATAGKYMLWDEDQDSLFFPDDTKIVLGTGSDTEIQQTGSETIIKDASTGNIKLRAGTVTIQNGAASKTMAVFNGANSVDLNYNNSKKFETTNTGIEVTGNIVSSNEDVYMFSNRGQGQTDATKWYGPNFQGIYNYSWSKDYGDDTGVLTLEEDYINTGLLVPYDCVLTGFFTIGHTNSGTAGYSCGLWYITQSNLASSLNVTSGQAGDATLTLAGTIGTTVAPGSAKNPLTIDKRGTMSVSLTAGSMIYPRVGDSAVVTDTTWNVYLKRT